MRVTTATCDLDHSAEMPNLISSGTVIGCMVQTMVTALWSQCRSSRKSGMLSKASKLVAGLLVPVLLGLPIASCLTPGRTMSEEEHNCCMKMASMCESSAMPASHSCCQHRVSPQAVAVSRVRNLAHAVLMAVLPERAPALFCAPIRHRAHICESPPESPPQTISVLRI